MLLFQLPFLWTALVLCLVLAGIHTWLGFHVIRRGVLFVDLALAQMAALGASIGTLLGWKQEGDWKAYGISLAFAMGGAFLFALFRQRQERYPIEALIGITYAGAIALAMIILEHSATGMEEIKEMLVGSLLMVSWSDVLHTGILYAIIGAVHWLARKRFMMISTDPDKARASGMNIRFWDFLFYATFAIVVTSSVKLAGVLVVFSMLVIPATAALSWKNNQSQRLAFAWIFGGLGSLIGLETSARLDWPAGPSIIVVFLVLLGISSLIKTKADILKQNH